MKYSINCKKKEFALTKIVFLLNAEWCQLGRHAILTLHYTKTWNRHTHIFIQYICFEKRLISFH